MDTRRVDEGHTAHADDADAGIVVHRSHHFLKLIGDTEIVRTVDFVNFYAFGNLKVFFEEHITFIVGVNLIGDDLNLCAFSHTLHEEEAGNDEAYFNRYGEVEDYREQERNDEHANITLGVA